MRVKLIVVGGKADRTQVNLRLPAVLGRGRDADLKLGHPSISRRHCLLVEQHGMVVVQDLRSTNGTFVDDQRVQSAVVEPGSRLQIGPLTFIVVYDRQRPADSGQQSPEQAAQGAETEPVVPPAEHAPADQSRQEEPAPQPTQEDFFAALAQQLPPEASPEQTLDPDSWPEQKQGNEPDKETPPLGPLDASKPGQPIGPKQPAEPQFADEDDEEQLRRFFQELE